MGQDKEWKKKHENKLEALGKKIEFERKNGLRPKSQHDHYLHPQLSFGVGGGLITLGFLENNIFFIIYLYGLLWTLKKYTDIGPDKKGNKFFNFVSNHPKYFALGGALSFLIFTSHGYQVGELNGLGQIVLTFLGF